jgi:hypothetical protein
MRRRIGQEEFHSLCKEVLDEAKETGGTWSLMTHGRISDAVMGVPSQEIEDFLGSVCERLIAPDATVGERFKLAQLCTMLRQKGLTKDNLNLDRVYGIYKEMLLRVALRCRDEPLGIAVGKLVASLFPGEAADRVKSARTSLCHPRLLKSSRRFISSRTPAF